MSITCPSCSTDFELAQGVGVFGCPHCRQPYVIIQGPFSRLFMWKHEYEHEMLLQQKSPYYYFLRANRPHGDTEPLPLDKTHMRHP